MTIEMNKQEAFLSTIAQKLGRPRKSKVKPPAWDTGLAMHPYREKTKEQLVEQFIESLALLDTRVERVVREELGSAVTNFLHRVGIRSAVCWNDEVLEHLGLSFVLSAAGVEHTVWDTNRSEWELRHAAAAADLGIAYADIGLAETGSVVLFNGGGKGRPVSALPPVFLCILSESSIVPRLTQAMEYIHVKMPEGLPACINFITGPSRSADIEMDLALGVHGPGKVHIMLLQE